MNVTVSLQCSTVWEETAANKCARRELVIDGGPKRRERVARVAYCLQRPEHVAERREVRTVRC